MIRTWIGEVSSLLEKQQYFEYYKSVPEHRQRKADNITFQEGRALSIGAWALFEMMQKEYHINERAVYNLSHSGRYVLCSVDDNGRHDVQIGCDIETIGRLRLDIARRFFCESELQYILLQETEEKQKEAFYRYWVLKESFMKATRLGMKLPLNAFEIELSEGGPPYLVKQPKGFQGRYYYKEYEVKNVPCRIAVCSDSGDISQETREIIF